MDGVLLPDAGAVHFRISTPICVWLVLPKLLGEASALKYFVFFVFPSIGCMLRIGLVARFGGGAE